MCQIPLSYAGGMYYFIKIIKVESHEKTATIYFEETPYQTSNMQMKDGIFEDCQTIDWTVGKQKMGFFATILDFFTSLFSTDSISRQLQRNAILQTNVSYLATHQDKIYEIHDIEAFDYVDKCHLMSSSFELSESSFQGIDKAINPKKRD